MYSTSCQKRKINTNPAAKSWIHIDDLSARYPSARVAQSLLGATKQYLIGFKVQSMRENPLMTLCQWGGQITEIREDKDLGENQVLWLC